MISSIPTSIACSVPLVGLAQEFVGRCFSEGLSAFVPSGKKGGSGPRQANDPASRDLWQGRVVQLLAAEMTLLVSAIASYNRGQNLLFAPKAVGLATLFVTGHGFNRLQSHFGEENKSVQTTREMVELVVKAINGWTLLSHVSRLYAMGGRANNILAASVATTGFVLTAANLFAAMHNR